MQLQGTVGTGVGIGGFVVEQANSKNKNGIILMGI